MVDITKCTNSDCPLKETCYRWVAPSSEMQSDQQFEYMVIKIHGAGEFARCDFYIKAVDTAK